MFGRISRKLTISLYRWVDDEFYRWTNKRHTGLTVSWHYTPPQDTQPDPSFTEDNKHFVQLARIIQLQGVGGEEGLEGLVLDMRREKMEEERESCQLGKVSKTAEKILSEIYQNLSIEAVENQEITKETLERATAIYIRLVFCPDYDPEIVKFYHDLFENFSLETILRTLARILYVAREKRLTEHYSTAWTLFDKITRMMELQHKDIALMTTGFTDLKQYPQLTNHTFNPERLQSKMKIE